MGGPCLHKSELVAFRGFNCVLEIRLAGFWAVGMYPTWTGTLYLFDIALRVVLILTAEFLIMGEFDTPFMAWAIGTLSPSMKTLKLSLSSVVILSYIV